MTWVIVLISVCGIAFAGWLNYLIWPLVFRQIREARTRGRRSDQR